MADETVPKADFEALQTKLQTLESEHTELKTTHAATLQTLQSVEAERSAASGKTEAWGQTVTDIVMAPVVARLVDPAVASLLPKPTLDPATGKVAEEWAEALKTWEGEHQSLFRSAVAAPSPTPGPAPAGGAPAGESPPATPRPSTPPSAGGNPVRTAEYWQKMMMEEEAQFVRRSKEYLADKAAGGW